MCVYRYVCMCAYIYCKPSQTPWLLAHVKVCLGALREGLERRQESKEDAKVPVTEAQALTQTKQWKRKTKIYLDVTNTRVYHFLFFSCTAITAIRINGAQTDQSNIFLSSLITASSDKDDSILILFAASLECSKTPEIYY